MVSGGTAVVNGPFTNLAVAVAGAAALAHLPEVLWPLELLAHGVDVPALDVRVKATDQALKELAAERVAKEQHHRHVRFDGRGGMSTDGLREGVRVDRRGQGAVFEPPRPTVGPRSRCSLLGSQARRCDVVSGRGWAGGRVRQRVGRTRCSDVGCNALDRCSRGHTWFSASSI